MQGTETEHFSKNTWLTKLKRTATSILPVDRNRKGTCKRCGACCKLPNHCPFLSTDKQGLSKCKIYRFRPLNCRKYPRSKSELITDDTCGYSFNEN
ncbi:MAG: YkgJ family cysteine cluster protein [Planctomycetota bacterium]|nr:MAG: YkgJ family cysteine cluster protein [Planctomycetota bacterium]